MKACGQCNAQFKIRDADREFYTKIDVPEPTQCPQCRMQRRLAYRSERHLYPRTCDLCKKQMLSVYAVDSDYTVYCPSCWFSDAWDATQYGCQFDFSRFFFEQFHELKMRVPRLGLVVEAPSLVNSDYTNQADHLKNAYLVFGAVQVEDSLYSYGIYHSKDCVDCFGVVNSELCYWCVDSEHCYGCQFSSLCSNCNECYFCFDCTGSNNCIFSDGLRNKSYHIFNKKVSKKEYQIFLANLKKGKFSQRDKNVQKYLEFIKKMPKRYCVQKNCEDTIGDRVVHGQNGYFCFDSHEFENLAYAMRFHGSRDSMDVCYFGFSSELVYEASTAGNGVHNLKFAVDTFTAISDCQYVDSCTQSNDLFGCAGLRKKSYVIFNTPYTREEYVELKEKIIAHMRKTKEYGEFFPVRYSPFAYNETAAQDFFPITEDRATQCLWTWRKILPGAYGKENALIEDLPDDISDVKIEEWEGKIIRCKQCSRNFKFVKQELQFYKRVNVPIPRECFSCRHETRLHSRNPINFWHRQCICEKGDHNHGSCAEAPAKAGGRCPIEFETTYAPDRPELVYCEQCYQKEVI